MTTDAEETSRKIYERVFGRPPRLTVNERMREEAERLEEMARRLRDEAKYNRQK